MKGLISFFPLLLGSSAGFLQLSAVGNHGGGQMTKQGAMSSMTALKVATNNRFDEEATKEAMLNKPSSNSKYVKSSDWRDLTRSLSFGKQMYAKRKRKASTQAIALIDIAEEAETKAKLSSEAAGRAHQHALKAEAEAITVAEAALRAKAIAADAEAIILRLSRATKALKQLRERLSMVRKTRNVYELRPLRRGKYNNKNLKKVSLDKRITYFGGDSRAAIEGKKVASQALIQSSLAPLRSGRRRMTFNQVSPNTVIDTTTASNMTKARSSKKFHWSDTGSGMITLETLEEVGAAQNNEKKSYVQMPLYPDQSDGTPRRANSQMGIRSALR